VPRQGGPDSPFARLMSCWPDFSRRGLAAGGDHPFRGMRRQLGKATMFAFSPIRGVQVPLRERETWTLPIRATPRTGDTHGPLGLPLRAMPEQSDTSSPGAGGLTPQLGPQRARAPGNRRSPSPNGLSTPSCGRSDRQGRSLICRWRAGLRVYKAGSADRSRARWWSSRPRRRSSAVTIRGAGSEGGSGSYGGQPKRAARITASSHSGTRL
jgi:hypothetical protein